MKIDKDLLQRINDVLKADINSGMYNNFPKLKSRLIYIKEKLVRFTFMINAEPISASEAKELFDNDIIDREVYNTLLRYEQMIRLRV